MKSGTIYALSSGRGRAGVAVYRLSGDGVAAALLRLLGRDHLPEPRRAGLATLFDPDTGEEVDRGLVLWFPAPESYTGEDVAELHVHGGRATEMRMDRLLAVSLQLRRADPGEFTRRAFENGKMDLTAAEGLADLVDAETETQRRQARRQMQGALGQLYEDWRTRLLLFQAHLEATIDFSDEELPEDLWQTLRENMAELQSELAEHLDDDHRGERLRDGVYLAIVGPPNSGKSSLLNLLAQREAAIVAAQAGTTRDVIEVHLDMDGFPVIVADTAGLRAAADAVEEEGVRRALDRAKEADLTITLISAEAWPEVDAQTQGVIVAGESLVAVNKIDLVRPSGPLMLGDIPVVAVSVETGEGISDLLDVLSKKVSARCGLGEAAALTRRRHREALEHCREAVDWALREPAPELAAEHLRRAVAALGSLTGRVGVEDMLDLVFKEFCIGK